MKEFLTGRVGNPDLEKLKKYIYAHRGYHDKPEIPENSMPAFRRALERGWGGELDVHMTADGRLAVFHDFDLKRITGTEGMLEEKTWEELSQLHLEGTGERMPLFDEVLELSEGRMPLIIELKTTPATRKPLAKAVCSRLASYKGLCCIESFDPIAMGEVRRLAPEIVRGQLSCNMYAETEAEIGFVKKILLTDLWFDFVSKPDFIAYKYEDRNRASLRKACAGGIQEVAWTIRRPEDFAECIRLGILPIFEQFDPEKEAGKTF